MKASVDLYNLVREYEDCSTKLFEIEERILSSKYTVNAKIPYPFDGDISAPIDKSKWNYFVDDFGVISSPNGKKLSETSYISVKWGKFLLTGYYYLKVKGSDDKWVYFKFWSDME